MSDAHDEVKDRPENTAVFCRMVRERSAENAEAMRLLFGRRLLAQCMGVLRLEVDSMVRVIYLLAAPPERRADLLEAAASGGLWQRESGKGRVTDREMVDLADRLNGWTASVYKFGCGFIHLSRYHDYNDTDPLALVSEGDRRAILLHMRNYHGGPPSEHPTFEELAWYFPMVFEKIRSNLECYVKRLEAGAGADD